MIVKNTKFDRLVAYGDFSEEGHISIDISLNAMYSSFIKIIFNNCNGRYTFSLYSGSRRIFITEAEHKRIDKMTLQVQKAIQEHNKSKL